MDTTEKVDRAEFFPITFSKVLRLAQMKDVWIGLDETNIFNLWLTLFDQTGQQLQPIQNQSVWTERDECGDFLQIYMHASLDGVCRGVE